LSIPNKLQPVHVACISPAATFSTMMAYRTMPHSAHRTGCSCRQTVFMSCIAWYKEQTAAKAEDSHSVHYPLCSPV